jgi:hypothetical protein
MQKHILLFMCIPIYFPSNLGSKQDFLDLSLNFSTNFSNEYTHIRFHKIFTQIVSLAVFTRLFDTVTESESVQFLWSRKQAWRGLNCTCHGKQRNFKAKSRVEYTLLHRQMAYILSWDVIRAEKLLRFRRNFFEGKNGIHVVLNKTLFLLKSCLGFSWLAFKEVRCSFQGMQFEGYVAQCIKTAENSACLYLRCCEVTVTVKVYLF